jgi:hypothetical protein
MNEPSAPAPGDFREICHLAHHHAIGRLLGGLRAESLMRPVSAPLAPGTMLDEAARAIVASGFKGLARGRRRRPPAGAAPAQGFPRGPGPGGAPVSLPEYFRKMGGTTRGSRPGAPRRSSP